MFKTEQQLVDIIFSHYHEKFLMAKNERVKIFHEYESGFGIADLVIVAGHEPDIGRQSALSNYDIAILQYLKQRKSCSVDEIRADMVLRDKKKILLSLNKMEKENLIKQTEQGNYRYLKYTSTVKRSIAIEAKLKNWKRALNQAYRYKWFASESIVIIPEKNSRSALANLDIFKKMGVGLSVVDADSNVIIKYEHEKTEPVNSIMVNLLNERFIFSRE